MTGLLLSTVLITLGASNDYYTELGVGMSTAAQRCGLSDPPQCPPRPYGPAIHAAFGKRWDHLSTELHLSAATLESRLAPVLSFRVPFEFGSGPVVYGLALRGGLALYSERAPRVWSESSVRVSDNIYGLVLADGFVGLRTGGVTLLLRPELGLFAGVYGGLSILTRFEL
ncbi:MAG: hypothetical protein AAFQ82_02440 [Myxococcota bacterium]